MGDHSHQDPILPWHGMQHMANMLGLKVTAESKNYVKSCVVDRYRRMAGQVEISCKRELKTEVSWREFLEWNMAERAGRQKLNVKKERKGWNSLV